MPHIDIKCFPRELDEQQKAALAADITDVIIRHLNSKDSSISIALQQIQPESWQAIFPQQLVRILHQQADHFEDLHYSPSALSRTSVMLMASIRLLLNRLNLLSEPWQPSPKVKPQPLRSAKASPAISRWLVGMTKRSS